MKTFLFALMLFCVSCSFHTPYQGPPGQDGVSGPKGDQGPSGSKGDTGTTGNNGSDGATGPKGDTGGKGDTGTPGANGQDGSIGPKGDPGNDGSPGVDGQDSSPVSMVELCPGVTSYPSVFVEIGVCLNGKLYGVYSANGGFMTYFPDGNYSSNSIGSACNLTIAGCVVSH